MFKGTIIKINDMIDTKLESFAKSLGFVKKGYSPVDWVFRDMFGPHASYELKRLKLIENKVDALLEYLKVEYQQKEIKKHSIKPKKEK